MIDNHIAALLAYAGRLDSRVRRTLADPQQSARTIADWTAALADVPATLSDTGWDASQAVRALLRAARRRPVRAVPARRAARRTRRMGAAPRRAHEPAHRPRTVRRPRRPGSVARGTARHPGAVATGHTPPAQYRAEINAAGQKRLAALVAGVGTGPRRYMPEHVARELAPFRPAQAQREALVAEGLPDPLGAKCPHCRAEIGKRCRSGYRRHREISGVHPSRIEAVVAQLGTQDERDEAERVRLAHLMCQPPAPRESRARHTTGGQHR